MKKQNVIDNSHNRWHYLVWGIGLIFPALFTIVSRVLMAQMSQEVVALLEHDSSTLSKILLIAASLLFGALIAEVSIGLFRCMLQKVRVEEELYERQTLFTRLVRMKLSGLDGLNRGELMQRYNHDVSLAAAAITIDLEKCVYPFLIGIGYCFAIMLKQGFVGIVLLCLIAVIAILNYRYIKKYQRLEKDILARKDDYSRQIDFSYTGKMMIRNCNLRSFAEKQINDAADAILNAEQKKVKLTWKKSISSDLLISFCSTLTLPVVCVIAHYGYLTLPEVMFIASLGASIMGFTSNFANALINLRNDYVSKTRVNELLSIPQENYGTEQEREVAGSKACGENHKVQDEKLRQLADSDSEGLFFHNVTIHYQDHVVLSDLCAEFRKGEITALIGKSGSGKSSLLKAIPQITEYEGEIKIGDVSLNQLPPNVIRKEVTYIADDNELYDTTLIENIRYGNESAATKEILSAMKAAQLLEFINQDTVMEVNAGGEGSRFSGGQKQRIAIARGLLKNSKVMLLDEPTSALDVMTEQKIMKQLRVLADQGACIIMAAHRLSAIASADRICLIKDKKLYENISFTEAIEYLSSGEE